MRHAYAKTGNAKNALVSAIAGSFVGRWALIAIAVLSCAVLVVAVRAYSRGTPNVATPAKHSTPALLQVTTTPQRGRLQSQLSLQPEADRFRRRLGQRFIAPGRERATLVGTLTIGAQQYQVRIFRTQGDDGEQVEISLNGAPASLTWNKNDGAKSAGSTAAGIERSLIERLALDSPDQFILAQV
jgi:hypothetical protein